MKRLDDFCRFAKKNVSGLISIVLLNEQFSSHVCVTVALGASQKNK